MTGATELAGIALMREFIPASPFAALLGIAVNELAADRAVLELPDRPELATTGTVVHGGALATLLDTAAMAAAWCVADPPASLRGSTAALAVTYLAPATGQVLATATVLQRGRTLVTLDVTAACGDREVAHALVTYRMG
jgi:uncharacterized protein (TIGR00369 family)